MPFVKPGMNNFELLKVLICFDVILDVLCPLREILDKHKHKHGISWKYNKCTTTGDFSTIILRPILYGNLQ